MHTKEYSIEIGGRMMTAIFSDLADQAHGSVMLKCGETIVLATACMSKEAEKGLDFFNLTVDYVEKFYAVGKILGSRFTRREGKPSNEAILGSRVIDRTIRPLFDKHLKHAVQVIVTVLSVDENDSVTLAVNAASLALAASNIPWAGPVGAIRFNNNRYDILVCGKENKISMIEAQSLEISESETNDVFKKTLEEIEKLENWQKKIVAEIGQPKHSPECEEIKQESIELYNKEIAPKLEQAIFGSRDGVIGKKNLNDLHSYWNEIVKKNYPDREDFGPEDDYFDDRVNDRLHEAALKEDRRADGRGMDELRPIFAQAGGFSKILHGSGIFYRGGTHTLSALTLGGPEDVHLIEGMGGEEKKRFMHHYNFPPFSSGEIGRATMTGRREIGHGALAEKALLAVLPSKEKFPYTIRIVSEALASNGSTSMGAVCGSTLALMDGGVPISRPVAGISVGLMLEEDPHPSSPLNYKLLTDIQGPEDHHGDMDFKIAGTREGITAVQLDIKVGGIPIPILVEALEKARNARLKILDIIEKELSAPRPDISPNAPKILTLKIKISQIGLVIGPGGKTIHKIQDETGATISIEEDGTIYITGKNGAAEKAYKTVEELTHEWTPGEMTKGEVVKIVDFGAFVRINPGTEGLVHISEIAPWRVNKMTDLLKEGMAVPIKIIEIDEHDRLKLSIKQADQNFFSVNNK